MQRFGRDQDTSQREALRAADHDVILADFCVVGAGPGGLAVAAEAAALGRKVVLIEKDKMGGGSLNSACVPSKALIASAKRAHAMRTAQSFGIEPVSPRVDRKAVRDHVNGIIAEIAPNASVERFRALGVRVIQAPARFLNRKTVAAGDHRITARRFVIATGSSPAVPPLPGFEKVPFFTNKTIFENTAELEHLIIIGGGPTGLELAQAHLRLGSNVTIVEGNRALSREDPELAGVVVRALRAEGLDIRQGALVRSVDGRAGSITVAVRTAAGEETIAGTHLLVAAGRRPNIADLGLDAAGIFHSHRGIIVSSGQLTSNPHVFAIGDCAEGCDLAHVASCQAGVVIRHALHGLPVTFKPAIVPRVTLTDPEIATVGLTESQARAKKGRIGVLRWPYAENDRAHIERSTPGFVKVITGKNGRILGASIAGAGAGELIQMWALAISQKMKISAMAQWVSPYPTLSEINRHAALRYYETAATNPVVRKLVGALARLG